LRESGEISGTRSVRFGYLLSATQQHLTPKRKYTFT
jgi:hypothetical protein